MCMQCMVGAMTAVGAANGARAGLSRMRAEWLTPRRRKRIGAGLLAAAALASSLLVTGPTAPTSAQRPVGSQHSVGAPR